jgi:hypothetical protein
MLGLKVCNKLSHLDWLATGRTCLFSSVIYRGTHTTPSVRPPRGRAPDRSGRSVQPSRGRAPNRSGRVEPSISEEGKLLARNGRLNFLSYRFDFHVIVRDFYHAANLRHGTHSFTSLPKEGMLRIFTPEQKIRRLRLGLNPRSWVPTVTLTGYFQLSSMG